MRSSRVYTVEGIVIKRKATGEADRILTVFTKQKGKMRVLARGIRRMTSRRAGHVEVFSHVILTLHGLNNLPTVSEAQAVTRGAMLESDSGVVAYAYCMCELVDQLTPEEQEQEYIFFLLRDALIALAAEHSADGRLRVMTGFIHALLWTLGFLPETRRLPDDSIQHYVEQITERKFRSWPLLTTLTRPS